MSQRFIFALPEWLPHRGGLATFYVHLAHALSHEGREAIFLVTQKDALDPALPGIRIVNLEAEKNVAFGKLMPALPEGSNLSAFALAHGVAFRDWLRAHSKETQDAVLFAPEFLGYASLLCGAEFPPLVVTAHGSLGQIAQRSGQEPAPDLPLVRALESEALLRAGCATAYSPLNADEWSEALGKPVRFVPPAFLPDAAPANHPKPGTPLRGIVAGRLQDWKGAETLAQALDALPADAPEFIVDWFGADTETAPGGGSMAAYLEKTYPDIWQKRLLWHRPVDRETLAGKRTMADFALVPSRWDTLNYTALEAMSDGLPVIVSTGAGASYLADETMRFPAGNADALCAALLSLVSQPDVLRQRGQAARKKIEESFTTAKVVVAYDEAAKAACSADSDSYATLRRSPLASDLLDILNSKPAGESLSQHGGRELLDALQKKVFARLGLH